MARLYETGWTIIRIAEAAERSATTIRYHLRQQNVAFRGPGRPPKRTPLLEETLAFIDGLLLGGAALILQKRAKTPYILLSQPKKSEKWVQEVQKTLESANLGCRRAILASGALQLATRADAGLRMHWRRWYSRGSRKYVVPKDVRLTPTTLRAWYFSNNLGAPFGPTSVQHLCEELQRLYGWRARVNVEDVRPRIWFPWKSDQKAFMQLIHHHSTLPSQAKRGRM